MQLGSQNPGEARDQLDRKQGPNHEISGTGFADFVADGSDTDRLLITQLQ
jgi:hypothetical protein